MTGDGHRPIPLWASSRGLHVMVRMALSQQGRTAFPAGTLAEFRRALDETRSPVVIVAAEDLLAGGLDPALLERLVGDGTAVVLLSAVRPLPEPPGPRTRVLPVPFTTRDLLDALAVAPAPNWTSRGPTEPQPAPTAPSLLPPSPAPPPPAPAPEVLADLVRREVERLVAETARQMVEEVARSIVPELAEAMIRAELARVLRESDEAAMTGPGGPDDDR
jgi:hypothetical protein